MRLDPAPPLARGRSWCILRRRNARLAAWFAASRGLPLPPSPNSALFLGRMRYQPWLANRREPRGEASKEASRWWRSGWFYVVCRPLLFQAPMYRDVGIIILSLLSNFRPLITLETSMSIAAGYETKRRRGGMRGRPPRPIVVLT